MKGGNNQVEWWKEQPWRLIQTNLREIDFINLSPEQFVKDIKSFCATVLLLNSAGISASYPTKLSYHCQNPYVTGNELSRIVELCHDEGIRVLARTDFSKVKKEIFVQHPDWAFRTKEGKEMEYNGYVQTCINSDYQQKYMFDILQEMFDEIPFDGFFCNMGGFQTKDYDFVDYGFCRCSNCRSKFKEISGENLPDKEDFQDPVYVKYTMFQRKIIKEHRKKVVQFLKQFPQDICFDDTDYARIESSTELKRRIPHWQYHASSNCRVITGDGENSIICSNSSVEFVGYGLRDISVSPALQAMRLWQNLANRGSLDYYIMGRIDNHLDKSSFEKIKEVFAFHKENHEIYRNLKPCTQVLLRRQDRWIATEEEKGWIRVLTECHIPFAEILPWEFGSADLSRYKLVIIPDSPYLTKEEEKKADDFVNDGGTLIIVGESGLYDENKEHRQTYGISCCGIVKVNRIGRNEISSMFIKEKEEELFFPSSKETTVFGGWDTYLYLEAEPDVKKLLKRVPVHPYGPPECCYFEETTDDPGIWINSCGKGKAVTIPWHPGTFYSITGHSNPFLFIKDVLIHICDVISIAENLTHMVETSLSVKQDGSLLLQMVNNSGCFGVSFFEPLPVYELKLAVPTSKIPKQIVTYKGGNIVWEYKDSILHLELDKLNDYEAVYVG